MYEETRLENLMQEEFKRFIASDALYQQYKKVRLSGGVPLLVSRDAWENAYKNIKEASYLLNKGQ
jgi:hypothetical protein